MHPLKISKSKTTAKIIAHRKKPQVYKCGTLCIFLLLSPPLEHQKITTLIIFLLNYLQKGQCSEHLYCHIIQQENRCQVSEPACWQQPSEKRILSYSPHHGLGLQKLAYHFTMDIFVFWICNNLLWIFLLSVFTRLTSCSYGIAPSQVLLALTRLNQCSFKLPKTKKRHCCWLWAWAAQD